LDTGAVQAITHRGKSLLSAGITHISGKFEAGETVSLCDATGTEIARGISNYSHEEVEKIKGCQSQQIVDRLGYAGAETVIHRDDLVLLTDPNSGLPHLAVEPTEC
jgi:glutamate 5-kinase